MKKAYGLIGFILVFLLVGMTSFIAPAWAIGPQDKVLVRQAKGVPATLFDSITESIEEADCDPINMSTYTAGSLDIVLEEGATGVSVDLKAYSAETGTYVAPAWLNAAGTGYATFPTCSVTTASRSFQLRNIHAKYIKFVPTVTSGTTVTITWTPSN